MLVIIPLEKQDCNWSLYASSSRPKSETAIKYLMTADKVHFHFGKRNVLFRAVQSRPFRSLTFIANFEKY